MKEHTGPPSRRQTVQAAKIAKTNPNGMIPENSGQPSRRQTVQTAKIATTNQNGINAGAIPAMTPKGGIHN